MIKRPSFSNTKPSQLTDNMQNGNGVYPSSRGSHGLQAHPTTRPRSKSPRPTPVVSAKAPPPAAPKKKVRRPQKAFCIFFIRKRLFRKIHVRLYFVIRITIFWVEIYKDWSLFSRRKRRRFRSSIFTRICWRRNTSDFSAAKVVGSLFVCSFSVDWWWRRRL